MFVAESSDVAIEAFDGRASSNLILFPMPVGSVHLPHGCALQIVHMYIISTRHFSLSMPIAVFEMMKHGKKQIPILVIQTCF